MKLIKRLFIVISILTCMTIVPLHAKELKKVYTGYHGIDFKPEERTQVQSRGYARGKSSFVDKYDPRDLGLVSNIKDQKATETCWAYSTVAMAECNLIKNGLADQSIDLSEHHLAYFVYHTSNDPLNNTEGDSVQLQYGNYLSIGGNYVLALQSLTSYSGLVNEDAVSSMPDSMYEPKVIDDDYQFEHNSYTLKNTYYANYDIETVKEFVTNYGAVGISYQSVEDESINYTYNTIYNPQGSVEEANHSVTIVGWDDNYSKTCFSNDPSNQPEHNGAWLIKNSWGKVGSEDGYFWLSYEEPSITDIAAAEFEKATYDHNYHYDGNLSPGYLTAEDELTFANVYQVKGNETGNDELLKAINIGVQSTDTEYSIEIYKNLKEDDDPTSGTLATSQPIIGKTTYTGYYTVELEEPIILAQGDYYSIVVTLKRPNNNVSMMAEMYIKDDWIVLEYGSNPNQSYCYNDEKWIDLHDEGCTARIKGLTVNTDTKSALKIDIPQSMSLNIGDKKQLEAVITPSNTTTKLTWESSQPDIVSVDENGNIKALSLGEALITVTTEYGSKDICLVTVQQNDDEKTDITEEKPKEDDTINQHYSNNDKEESINVQDTNDKVSIQDKKIENNIPTNQAVKTSDDYQIGLWISIMSIALLGIVVIKRKNNY